jgi:hypothetical protein
LGSTQNPRRTPEAGFGEWVVQQLREAFPEAGPQHYVILDHDAKFNADVLGFPESNRSNAQADQP